MATESTENEQRRRKQTLERAKANHLSRQLQMRLQYARLKVEHGWQRQNLNEVENLYFHHSQRHPRSQNSKHSWITTTTAPAVPPAPALPRLSRFEEVSEIQSRERLREDQIPGLHAFPLDPAPIPIDPALMTSDHRQLSPPPTHPSTLMVWETEPSPDVEKEALSRGSSSSSIPGLGNPPTTFKPSPPPHAPLPFHANSILRPEVLEGATSTTTPTSNAAATRKTGTPQSSFTFGTGSLTYDSFWSSHSASSMAYRSAGARVAEGGTGAGQREGARF